ncbi:MAG: hypothetical protein AAF985_19990 [Bacteroidota bacterium]
MKTTVKIVQQEALSPAQKENMWLIYKHYYHYSKESFMARINRNTHFALYQRNGKIGGFTGLRINALLLGGRKRFLIYYGQTILPWGYKGATLLPLTALKLVLKHWKELLFQDAWFWYDSLTYKAYLISAKSLAEYYPNFRGSSPEYAKEMVDHLGKHYYGESYHPKTGTVSKSQNFVKDKKRSIYERLLQDRDIAFYAKANPAYADGHGLITYAPINLANIFALLGGSIKKRWKMSSWKKRFKPSTIKVLHRSL